MSSASTSIEWIISQVPRLIEAPVHVARCDLPFGVNLRKSGRSEDVRGGFFRKQRHQVNIQGPQPARTTPVSQEFCQV